MQSLVSISEFNNKIEFQNVSFHYEDDTELVLDDINLSVVKGDGLLLLEAAALAKLHALIYYLVFTTLLRKILLDGIDIKEIRLEDLRKLMGIVTQETVLFNESVK